MVSGDHEFVELLSKVWTQIPGDDQRVICKNLVSIRAAPYSGLDDEQQKSLSITSRESGATWYDKEERGCVVRIDTSRQGETMKVSIAHELAHVFYNHPKRSIDPTVADEEAKAKVKEWRL